jgi:predicted nucleotidyltransferase component of viral defense system
MSKAESVKARLKNLARIEKKPFDYLLNLYCIERLIYRLSISRFSELFVLKGGMFLFTIMEEKARATKDLDMLAKETNNSIENLEGIFKEIVSIQVEDGVIFIQDISVSKIMEGADYDGIRVKIVALLNRTKVPVQVDIGFGDIVYPEIQTISYPTLLTDDNIKVHAYSLESLIAEKFDAMLTLAQANSRMKDFYDIYYLRSMYKFDGKTLLKAFKLTLNSRENFLEPYPVVFEDAFGQDREKNIQWKAFLKRINNELELIFEEVIASNRDFLKPVYLAILNSEDYCFSWDPIQAIWQNHHS